MRVLLIFKRHLAILIRSEFTDIVDAKIYLKQITEKLWLNLNSRGMSNSLSIEEVSLALVNTP
jgi:hypothetical protein